VFLAAVGFVHLFFIQYCSNLVTVLVLSSSVSVFSVPVLFFAVVSICAVVTGLLFLCCLCMLQGWMVPSNLLDAYFPPLIVLLAKPAF
jgi:hypothetical protein